MEKKIKDLKMDIWLWGSHSRKRKHESRKLSLYINPIKFGKNAFKLSHLLILVTVCKLTHSLTDTHTLPLSVESLFMPAIASSFHRDLMLHVQSVQDSLLINMITLPKIWSVCASSRQGWCEDNAHPDPFHTNTHVSRIFLDFSLCWIFFPFGSKWILI